MRKRGKLSDEKLHEAANVLLPLQNSLGVRAYYGGIAGPATQAVCLPTHFGNHSQHFYTAVFESEAATPARGDGVVGYMALSRVPTGSIDPGATSATGVPTAAGFPMVGGQRYDGTVVGGRPLVMTGIPTGTPTFLDHNTVLFRCASGVGSAFFKLFRTSVGPGGGVEEFTPPGRRARGR